MEPGDGMSFPEAVTQSLRDGYAAEFGRMEAELDVVALSLGIGHLQPGEPEPGGTG